MGIDNLYISFDRDKAQHVVGVNIESDGGGLYGRGKIFGARPIESSSHAEKVIDQAQPQHQ
jgi:hypothetical protein